MSKQPLKPTDLILVLLALVGILLFWIQLDPTGYLMYSVLMLMTIIIVAREVRKKKYNSRYPKLLFYLFGGAIIITGIDRIFYKELNPILFTVSFILFIFIQPKPAWITRP